MILSIMILFYINSSFHFAKKKQNNYLRHKKMIVIKHTNNVEK